jgi:hypothetical protein
LHGYTVAEVQRLARLVASQRHPFGIAHDDVLDAARAGIVHTLLTADRQPDATTLLRAAENGITALVDAELREQGRARRSGRGVVAMPHYYRWWWDITADASSPEPGVVGRRALSQILAVLKPHHLDTLQALADHRDHRLAAESLGISGRAYSSRLRKARAAFLALWHEGEEPSRPWRRDHPTAAVRAMKGLRERQRNRAA